MSFSTSRDVLAAHLAGEAVLLNLDDKSYYRLNETAALIWAALEKGEAKNDILAQLIEQFDGDETIISKELDIVIDDFKKRKLVVEKSDT